MSNSRYTGRPTPITPTIVIALACSIAAWTITACTERVGPVAPTRSGATEVSAHSGHVEGGEPANPHNQASDDKGYIDGWFDGATVQLYYTKVFFCAEPPTSQASDSDCELGAEAEVAPRPGPIPTIYAIAWTGGSLTPPVFPDLATLACAPGSVCLNHPAHIDISRLRPGVTNAPALPHSHIVAEHHAGWFNTVNIRVSDLNTWNQIAEAKSLVKVRDLQADPNFGGKGFISQDTPTNIFFFIASWRY